MRLINSNQWYFGSIHSWVMSDSTSGWKSIDRFYTAGSCMRKPNNPSVCKNDQNQSAHRNYLSVMGIQAWKLRQEFRDDRTDEIKHSVGLSSPCNSDPDVANMDWPTLRKVVENCTRCGLAENRTQTVFGIGNPNADWMIIGEGPGAEEDKVGEPFVGRAGHLLDNMLLSIGKHRENVFIANVIKCRPPGNRDPQPEEVAACAGYLERQILLVNPGLILALGRFAAQTLLQVDTPVGKLRGRIHYHDKIPLVVTYHPAYLLRSPERKADAWDDLCLARACSTGEAS